MVAFAILLLLLPAVLLAIAIVSAMTEGRRSPYDFAIGRVLSNSFVVIGSAPLAIVGASFLVNASVNLATQALPSTLRGDWAIAAAGGFLYFIVTLFLQLFTIRVALDILEGRLLDLHDALAIAGRRLLPAMGVVILSTIAIGFGFVLLVVPGILLLLSWFVVLPVIVVEGGGVMDAFGRSTELVRGMRWRLLILLIIAMVIALLAAIPGELLTKVAGVEGRWVIAAVDTLTGTLTGVLQFAGVATVYHEARTAKEGTGDRDLEAVFA